MESSQNARNVLLLEPAYLEFFLDGMTINWDFLKLAELQTEAISMWEASNNRMMLGGKLLAVSMCNGNITSLLPLL